MPNFVPFTFLIKLTQKYGIAPSMSRRGNCYGNAMAENFFSILQTECICRHKPTSFHEANEMMDRYIHFYSYERIQLKTGVAPLTLRAPGKMKVDTRKECLLSLSKKSA